MKKWATVVMVAVLITSAFAYGGAPKGKKGMIVGEAVELSTYAMLDESIETYLESQKNRAKLGFPVAIIEEGSGDVYVCVYRNSAPASSMTPANDILGPLLGQKVAAQGLIYKRGSVNVIRLSIVSEY